jgi:GntR family transcriptional repressor for pyruvate dehydrogenase complex
MRSMRTFSKAEKQRLPEIVAEQIEEAIIGGDFVAGSQLPSEQQLADQFEVSRNVVREAFKYLQERGLIQIINGSGTYVTPPSAAPTSTALGRYIRLLGHRDSITALYEARRVLEGNNARVAAQRADDSDIAALEHCLTDMREGVSDIGRWSQADLEFHLTTANATHNPFFRVLLEPLVDQLREVIAEGYLVEGAVERGLNAHILLMQAIRARDSEAAYQAIIEHLRDSEARVAEYQSQRTI